MRKVFILACTLCFLLGTTVNVMGDWVPDDGHKMHFPQYPDLTGWNVNATNPLILADDWMCSSSGPVTDIHFWGSWQGGLTGEIISFNLSIHADIPASPPEQPYSKPGVTLWEVEVPFAMVIAQEFTSDLDEGWYSPMDGFYNYPDHNIYWQYNVFLEQLLPPEELFVQEEGTIYWLNISATVATTGTTWGWKTSLDHWNDDCVWGLWGVLDWIEIFDPIEPTVSLDLAFVINGPEEEVGACCYPDPFGYLGLCVTTTEDSCTNYYLGVWEGAGTVCGGMEACCLQDGSCIDADALCCAYEIGGTPQGAGTACSATQACCFSDGSCQDLDPLCCVQFGGTPQGVGTFCQAVQACCMSDGSCRDLDPLCCAQLGGVPQGAGTLCSADLVACCFSDGTCTDVDPLCCDEMGGTISPYGITCQGDNNLNGIDDACEEMTGACCLADGSCLIATAAGCLSLSGDYKGDGTVCIGDSDGDGFDDICVDPWPDHKMHNPQLPDESGWDVAATAPMVLADDWMCTESGPVTDIHFWGSWLDDNEVPITAFIVSIWSDMPAAGGSYSRPDQLLWEETFTTFDIIPYDPATMEGWYDPQQELVLFDNHVHYYRYDIYPEEGNWFVQDSGTIYWLSVSAIIEDPTGSGANWGWKSSINHWNDDAVWTSAGLESWYEMYEPPDPIFNEFGVEMGPANVVMGGFGSNAYGLGWYFYYVTEWWNIWFYDHPFSYDRYKEITIDLVDILPTGEPTWLELAVNWSTDVWSLEGNPDGPRRPPLPDDQPEDIFIGRFTLYQGEVIPGPMNFSYIIPYYNPEWVSIDIRGENFVIPAGVISHDCRASLDLAFVITSTTTCMGTCGDANGDGIVNVSDAVKIINYIFIGGMAPIPLACGDANNDCVVNVSDAVRVINYIFIGGVAPGDCCPGSSNWTDGDCCPFAK